jgi:hypothetical protein
MAVAGWMVLGAIAGVVLNRLTGESARTMPITVIGAMSGALLGGTVVSAGFGRGAIGYEAVAALIILAAAAAVRIWTEEGNVGD